VGGVGGALGGLFLSEFVSVLLLKLDMAMPPMPDVIGEVAGMSSTRI